MRLSPRRAVRHTEAQQGIKRRKAQHLLESQEGEQAERSTMALARQEDSPVMLSTCAALRVNSTKHLDGHRETLRYAQGDKRGSLHSMTCTLCSSAKPPPALWPVKSVPTRCSESLSQMTVRRRAASYCLMPLKGSTSQG